jgi:hypothetical protein
MVREQPGTRIIVLLVIVAVLATIPLLVGAVISEVLGTVMVFMLLGLGLNIVVGYAGLLDLGYVAFFGFGAYATALLTGATLNTTTGSAAPAFSMHLNFYVAIPIIVLLAAGVGVLIGAPVLRLRGDYLAIATLGLGEMVSIPIWSNWLFPKLWWTAGCGTSATRAMPACSGSAALTTSRSPGCSRSSYLAIGELTHRRAERDARTNRWPTPWASATHSSSWRSRPAARGDAGGALLVKIGSLTPQLRDHRLDHRAPRS